MSRGYVYILTNEAMPGLIKIGKTTRSVSGRANELYQTGVPLPFEVALCLKSPDCDELEQWAHDAFADERVSTSREFFRCDLEQAKHRLIGLFVEQMGIWVEDFMPGYRLIHEDVMVTQADVLLLANELGEHPTVTADALANVTADELRPAIERVHTRKANLRVVS